MKYIRFNTQTKKVVAVCIEKPPVNDSEFINLSGEYAVAEFNDEVPKGDYLTVGDAQIKIDNSRNYIACSLITNKREYTPEQLEAVKEKKYKCLVAKYIRQKYSANDVEALLANICDEPDNEDYINEMKAFQEYRKQCKERAKLEL